jgi:HEPN domain-containing protein
MDDERALRQQELARLLLAKAEQDLALVDWIGDSEEIADEIVGFHAQQAIEKALKAVLTRLGIEYLYTHDLFGLRQQAEKAGAQPPDQLDIIEELADFAVQFRYLLLTTHPLDRARSEEAAAAFIEWARTIVENPVGH